VDLFSIIFGRSPTRSAHEARDCPARDGDEQERKSLPEKTGPVPSMNRVVAGIASFGATW
jgi:hypothetical protein